MPDLIDLRSDTVTHPTPEMRRAMAAAEVGDDVFEDDPTVIALEERAAELLGKEAGLFVTSGTMGNLVSQMAHVPRGGEIIAETDSHIVLDEAAGHAVVVGASVRAIPAVADGRMDPDAIREAFRDPTDPHEPITALIALENTHAHSMGQPLDVAYTAEIGRIARERGVPLHIDGARLFNAAVALGIPARELVAPADSVTFCLSKGLACPDRVRGGRFPRLHLAGAAGAQAARWRAAPGGRAGGTRAHRPARRTIGHDRTTRRGPPDGSPAGRWPGRTSRASATSTRQRVRTDFVMFRVDQTVRRSWTAWRARAC